MLRLIFLLLFPFTISAQLKRFQFIENKMGSPFTITFYHTDSIEATFISKECFRLVDSLIGVYSDYSTTSEVDKLALQPNIKDQIVSDELFDMILWSRNAWMRSGKTFDVTIGALTQLWRKANAENRFPSEAEIKAAKRLTGFHNLKIDILKGTITFRKPGMRFDFGGIAKGYIAQKVVFYLRAKNILISMADAGGDIATGNAPPDKNGWIIGINKPGSDDELWDQKLELRNVAVATSGDIYRFTIHNGKKYSHIIDPKTGYGVTSQRNVTVIFKDGGAADWIATACSILPIRKALRLAKNTRAHLLISTFKNGKLVTYKDKDFDRYFQKKQP